MLITSRLTPSFRASGGQQRPAAPQVKDGPPVDHYQPRHGVSLVPLLGAAVGAAAGLLAGAPLLGAGLGLAAGYVARKLPQWLTPEGPRLIVGHVGDEGARLWGRGDREHPVMFVEVRDEGKKLAYSGHTVLTEDDGFTGTLDVDGLEPGRVYTCSVAYGATSKTPAGERRFAEHGRFKTDKNDGDVTFLMGSCNLHRLWRAEEAFERIQAARDEHQADFMLHTGDQIYADLPLPSSSLEGYRGNYRSAWGSEAAQALLKESGNYMICDDHEVVNGFGQSEPLGLKDRAWLFLDGLRGKNKKEALTAIGLKAYREFQHSHNPHTFGPDALYYTFERGPARFFVADTRSERSAETGEMIGVEQLERLKDWLKTDPEAPKFVVTSVPFLAKTHEEDAKWTSHAFQSQRDEILDFLADNDLRNVVFLTGDSHNSYHAETRIERPDGTEMTVHELACSPVNGAVLRGIELYQVEHEGQTPGGSRYTTRLDESSFLGGKQHFSRDYSAVMAVHLHDDAVDFSIHRTHRDDDAPARSGRFQLS